MSLKTVLDKTTIKARKEILSEYLHSHDGELPTDEQTYFKNIFALYYTPDEDEIKFDSNDISSVKVSKGGHHSSACFTICVYDTWYPAAINRLSGSNRTASANLVRALRSAIEYQRDEFKRLNPLNPMEMCPINHNQLGHDAQADHVKPFHIIVKDWLKTLVAPPKCKYILDTRTYVIDEPFLSNWCAYHLEHARWRWLSKEANKYAHKLYVSP